VIKLTSMKGGILCLDMEIGAAVAYLAQFPEAAAENHGTL